MDDLNIIEQHKNEILAEVNDTGMYIQPEYPSIWSEVVHPELTMGTTQYFWKRWMSKLGPGPSILLMRLRQLVIERLCHGSLETALMQLETDLSAKESRQLPLDLTYREVHDATGLSRATVDRYLNDPCMQLFVRRETTYQTRHEDGMVNRRMRLHVMMADPIAPEEHDLVKKLIVERRLNAWLLRGRTPQSTSLQNDAITSTQNDAMVSSQTHAIDNMLGACPRNNHWTY